LSGCEAESLGPARMVRVASLADLVRLASSFASRMVVMPVYRFVGEGGALYFLQMMYKDYYRCYGVPVVYYYWWEGDELPPEKAKYVLVRGDETGEKVEVSDRTRPGWIIVPLINLAELPPYVRLES